MYIIPIRIVAGEDGDIIEALGKPVTRVIGTITTMDGLICYEPGDENDYQQALKDISNV